MCWDEPTSLLLLLAAQQQLDRVTAARNTMRDTMAMREYVVKPSILYFGNIYMLFYTMHER